ncbi:ATP-binding cassette, subfamily B [Pseudonocardia thermophila]|uniref:Fatty acid ABC transporter ATP-binding/permease protein n=1 Tax=Pseudonocardia thermophila TaxID=1848 RepID=A0A1M6Q8A1_PSETH|nr:ABC transporter ATP-binding protein [Pseudonocardia thermophila]SHK16337.1 ATP-binding cassette, subfamily B [Pseudonocardia thermophila]
MSITAAPTGATMAEPDPTIRPADRRRAALRLALRSYLGELARHRWLTVGALLLPALANIGIFYLPPLVVAGLVTDLSVGRTDSTLPAVALFAGAMLCGEALYRLGMHCLIRVDAYGIESLYVRGMDALLAKDAAFFHENFAGSLTKRVLSYAAQFEGFVDTLVFNVTSKLVPLAFAAVVLWQYDPLLVGVLAGTLVIAAVLLVPLIRRRQVLVDAREASLARVSGHVSDTLSNMDAVRAHAAELREAAEHRRRVAANRALAMRSWDYSNLCIDVVVAPLSVLVNGLGLMLAIGVATRPGGPGVAAVVVVVAYFLQAAGILFEFNQTYRNLERSTTEAAQFAELLLDEPEIVDAPDPEPLRPTDAAVGFDRVRFTHSGQDRPLFDGLDLVIGDGERVGLVGRSGGGKTTMLRLLLRLTDVQGGRILVGGQDVRRLTQADLRSRIAYVPQDPVMFHRTLGENIAFGRPDATAEEIRAAAAAAHVLDFAEALPDGFDTLVGERGVKLSGGQRQRVAIARAILRNAAILLLDEATSALDSESEALIQEALHRLMRDRTTIAIAHRLSTVAGMDRLVVVEQGRIVEQGTHAELLAAGGQYAALWERQSGGFLTG